MEHSPAAHHRFQWSDNVCDTYCITHHDGSRPLISYIIMGCYVTQSDALLGRLKIRTYSHIPLQICKKVHHKNVVKCETFGVT